MTGTLDLYQSGAEDDTGTIDTDGLSPTFVSNAGTPFAFQSFASDNVLRLGDGNPASGMLTFTTPKEFDNLAILAASANASPNSIGTFTITFADGSTSGPINYTATEWSDINAPNAALPAPVQSAINGSPQTGPFGGVQLLRQMFETDINLAALGLNDKPIVSITFNQASFAGETGIFAISGTSVANYTFAFVNGTLSITRAPLTVTANDATKRYGAANPAFTAKYSGFVNNDSPSDLGGTLHFNTPATTASSVGPYTVTPGGLTSSNYTITFADGTLDATPVPLTVQADDATKTYGQPNPPFSVTYQGFVNDDTPADLGGTLHFKTLATSVTPPGKYFVAPAGLTSNNYTITFVDGTLVITKAPLTIIGGDSSRLEGQPNPEFSALLEGFLDGDGPAALIGVLDFSTPASTSSPPGMYAVLVGGVTSDYYQITFVNGTLHVLPADNQSSSPSPTFFITTGGGSAVANALGASNDTTASSENKQTLESVAGLEGMKKTPTAASSAGAASAPEVSPPPRPPAPAPSPVVPPPDIRLSSRQRLAANDQFWNNLDKLRDEVGGKKWAKLREATFVTTVLASAGYILLNGRGAVFLLSLLSSRPLWHRFDPLEILFAWEDEKKRRRKAAGESGDERETLQSLVER